MSETAVAEQPNGDTRPLDKLFAFVRWTIIVYLGFSVLFVIASLAGASINPDLITDDDSWPQDATEQAALLAYGLSAIALMIAYLVSIVAVIRFTYRAMRNLHQLGEPRVEISPGWAVGWYFVPFANLFKPLQAMREIVEGSYAQAGKSLANVPNLGLWWGTWIVGNIASNVSWRMTGEAVLWADLISTLIHIASAYCLLEIVKDIAETQKGVLAARVF